MYAFGAFSCDVHDIGSVKSGAKELKFRSIQIVPTPKRFSS